jgi:5-formyltetrahydrofolate cyclo-ligase
MLRSPSAFSRRGRPPRVVDGTSRTLEGRQPHIDLGGAGPRAAEEGVIADPAEPGTALREAKTALRRKITAARAGLTDEQRAEAGRRLRDTLLSLPEAQMAGTVAAYYSTGTEPSTRGLVYALWKRGTYVLLPLLRSDGDLDWGSYEGPESVTPAGQGLLEPAQAARHSIASADLVIVPALAADRRGNRLGRGRGCYDGALAQVGPLIPTIALLYDGELLDRVPSGPLDRPVRMAAQPSAGLTRLTPP